MGTFRGRCQVCRICATGNFNATDAENVHVTEYRFKKTDFRPSLMEDGAMEKIEPYHESRLDNSAKDPQHHGYCTVTPRKTLSSIDRLAHDDIVGLDDLVPCNPIAWAALILTVA